MNGFTPISLVLLAAGSVCLMTATYWYHVMISEVNRHLPPDQRFRHYFEYPGMLFEVQRKHREIYPQSSIRLLTNSLAIIGFLFIIGSAWSLGIFDWSHIRR